MQGFDVFMAALFWGSACVLFYVYCGYGFLLAAMKCLIPSVPIESGHQGFAFRDRAGHRP